MHHNILITAAIITGIVEKLDVIIQGDKINSLHTG